MTIQAQFQRHNRPHAVNAQDEIAESRADFPAIVEEFRARMLSVEFPDDRYNRMRGIPFTRFEEIFQGVLADDSGESTASKGVMLIIGIVLSWVAPHNINPATMFIRTISEPLLRPFRRFIPSMGGIDISPVFALILLMALSILLAEMRPIPI